MSPAQSSTWSLLHVSETVSSCVCWVYQMFHMLMSKCIPEQRVAWIWSCSSHPSSCTTQSKFAAAELAHTVNKQYMLNAWHLAANHGLSLSKMAHTKFTQSSSSIMATTAAGQICKEQVLFRITDQKHVKQPISCEKKLSHHSYRIPGWTKYCTLQWQYNSAEWHQFYCPISVPLWF